MGFRWLLSELINFALCRIFEQFTGKDSSHRAYTSSEMNSTFQRCVFYWNADNRCPEAATWSVGFHLSCSHSWRLVFLSTATVLALLLYWFLILGAPCGLLNHLTASCRIVTHYSDIRELPAFLTDLGMVSCKSIAFVLENDEVRILLHSLLINSFSWVVRAWGFYASNFLSIFRVAPTKLGVSSR